MANLVPQLAKKKIALEYWVRVATAWFLFWTVMFIVCAVLLFPVYIFTNTQVAVYSEHADAAEESVLDYETVTSELEKANDQAKQVVEDSRKNRAYQYLALLDSLEGQGVSLTKISFVKEGKDIEPISLMGVADDRESLAAFRDRVLGQEVVDSVDLPISNLAKDSDIAFTMEITMVKNPSL